MNLVGGVVRFLHHVEIGLHAVDLFFTLSLSAGNTDRVCLNGRIRDNPLAVWWAADGYEIGIKSGLALVQWRIAAMLKVGARNRVAGILGLLLVAVIWSGLLRGRDQRREFILFLAVIILVLRVFFTLG